MPDDFDLVILAPDGAEPHGLTEAKRISAEEFAEKLAALAKVLHEKLVDVGIPSRTQESSLALADLTVGVAVSAEGNLGIVKGSATGSIQLRFSRRVD